MRAYIPARRNMIRSRIRCCYQARVQEFVRGCFLLFNFSGGGPAQKIAEKVIFSTKKVAKHR